MTFRTYFKFLSLAVPMGIALIDMVGHVSLVEGFSMQPQLNPKAGSKDVVYLSKLRMWRRPQVRHGDVIALRCPHNTSQLLIKRVVGLEGDLIHTLGYPLPVMQVPQGHCWVEGDNTGHSMDSNFFGPVSLGLVTARATCIVWPPKRWQMLHPHLPPNRVPLNLLTKD